MTPSIVQINSEDVTVKEEAGQAVVQLVVYAESSQHFSSSSAQVHYLSLPFLFALSCSFAMNDDESSSLKNLLLSMPLSLISCCRCFFF